MNQIPLPNLSLTKHNHIEVKVLAHSSIEIKFRPLLSGLHHCRVVLVSYFFVYHSVTTVSLCIHWNGPSILFNSHRELLYHCLLILCLAVSSHLASLHILLTVILIEDAWSEVLCIQNSNLFLVYNDKQERFWQKKDAVDAERITYVEPVKLQLGRVSSQHDFPLIVVHCQLDGSAPSYCQHRVGLVSKSGC